MLYVCYTQFLTSECDPCISNTHKVLQMFTISSQHHKLSPTRTKFYRFLQSPHNTTNYLQHAQSSTDFYNLLTTPQTISNTHKVLQIFTISSQHHKLSPTRTKFYRFLQSPHNTTNYLQHVHTQVAKTQSGMGIKNGKVS